MICTRDLLFVAIYLRALAYLAFASCFFSVLLKMSRLACAVCFAHLFGSRCTFSSSLVAAYNAVTRHALRSFTEPWFSLCKRTSSVVLHIFLRSNCSLSFLIFLATSFDSRKASTHISKSWSDQERFTLSWSRENEDTLQRSACAFFFFRISVFIYLFLAPRHPILYLYILSLLHPTKNLNKSKISTERSMFMRMHTIQYQKHLCVVCYALPERANSDKD